MKPNCQNKLIQIQIRQRTNLQAPVNLKQVIQPYNKIQIFGFLFEASCTKVTKHMKPNCQNKLIQIQIRQRTNLQAPVNYMH